MGQEPGNFGDLVLALMKSNSEQIPHISEPCSSYLLAILFDRGSFLTHHSSLPYVLSYRCCYMFVFLLSCLFNLALC